MTQKYSWGGYRPGSGRRPKGEVSGVSHHTRGDISPRHPLRVQLKTKSELGNLRKKRTHEVIRAALSEGCEGEQFRICHYALQRHGILLIVEAGDRTALSRGMQGISVRIAKGLNRLWERNGSVFADRYETAPIKTARAARGVLCFVLNNARLHERLKPGRVDPYSSGAYFDGWVEDTKSAPDGRAPVAKPKTNMLKNTWRKYGLLGVDEVPEELELRAKPAATQRTRS
ncbi:conserved hypothetical protein [Haliangium ochraceum DSM 14365]|uniref:Transposase IS200-like domain-containing protein n=1 Tax=Haliangium ochraceum (strain DSM 14365 / JCM 11303 / SMP-2) TaxID=502025 RepID=D0LKK0_HALO1|nr:conserved hypothetical protein [Haliangium ochraceum DSM 14365]